MDFFSNLMCHELYMKDHLHDQDSCSLQEVILPGDGFGERILLERNVADTFVVMQSVISDRQCNCFLKTIPTEDVET